MKNIFDILSSVGLTIPEDKKHDFETAFNENYKTAAEAEKLRTARDNYKSQLETAQTALKGFEGVNVEELKSKIQTLTNDLSTKEAEFNGKIEEMEFNSLLDSALKDSGARSTKAVRALLDIDTLKASKNRSDDIKKAIETVRGENDYMFEQTPSGRFSGAVNTSGANIASPQTNKANDALRAIFRKD